jgi:hypothetical protein
MCVPCLEGLLLDVRVVWARRDHVHFLTRICGFNHRCEFEICNSSYDERFSETRTERHEGAVSIRHTEAHTMGDGFLHLVWSSVSISSLVEVLQLVVNF